MAHPSAVINRNAVFHVSGHKGSNPIGKSSTAIGLEGMIIHHLKKLAPVAFNYLTNIVNLSSQLDLYLKYGTKR